MGRGSDTAQRAAACRLLAAPQAGCRSPPINACTHSCLYNSGAMSLQQRGGSGSEDSGAAAGITMQEMRRHLEGV